MSYIEPFDIQWENNTEESEKDNAYTYYKEYFTKKYNLTNLKHASEGVYSADGRKREINRK